MLTSYTFVARMVPNFKEIEIKPTQLQFKSSWVHSLEVVNNTPGFVFYLKCYVLAWKMYEWKLFSGVYHEVVMGHINLGTT